MTSTSDIVDHCLVALIPTVPIAIPLVIGQIRGRRKVTQAVTDATETLNKTNKRIDDVHEELGLDPDEPSVLTRIEAKLDNHVSNSEEAWQEHDAELSKIQAALGWHLADNHTHTHSVKDGKTSPPVKKAADRQRQSALARELIQRAEEIEVREQAREWAKKRESAEEREQAEERAEGSQHRTQAPSKPQRRTDPPRAPRFPRSRTVDD